VQNHRCNTEIEMDLRAQEILQHLGDRSVCKDRSAPSRAGPSGNTLATRVAVTGRLSYSHNIIPVSRLVSPPMSDPTSPSRSSYAPTDQHPNQHRFRPDRISHRQPVEEKRPVRIPASVSAREYSLGTRCSKLEVFCRLLLQRRACCCSRSPFSEDEEPMAR